MIDSKRNASGLACVLLVGGFFLPVQAGREGALVDDYAIDAEFFPEEGRMTAIVDIAFVPGSMTDDTLVFYLHGELAVDRLENGGRPLEAVEELVLHEDDYSYVARRVKVAADEVRADGRLRVAYSGYFNPSVVRAPSNYMRIDDDGVFLRSLGYSIWFPVFVSSWRDSYDVSFSRVTFKTPAEFRTVFAGEQLGERVEGRSRIADWAASRLNLFDAQFTARRFDVMIDGGFHLYHLRDSVAQMKASEILSFSRRLEQLYRAHYRSGVTAGQIHVMQLPRFGDIASGNVVGISDNVWSQFAVTAWQSTTVAHELVHSFVRLPSSSEMASFVIEGFPSYLHLPVMAEILGEEWYQNVMRQVESQYLAKRATGKGRRGEPLPLEKPILEIGTDEISKYKDTYVLNDRVRLFFDYLRRRLGPGGFFQLTSDLLNRSTLDYATLAAVIDAHLPNSGSDVIRWLRTTEFPDEFRLDRS